MNKVTVYCNHPFVAWKLTELRDTRTVPRRFHELVFDITLFLLYEACRTWPSKEVEVWTPTGETATGHVPANKIAVVPVLRAGIRMVDAATACIPGVEICHLGLERDERTFAPRCYYEKKPASPKETWCIVVDPMIATGGSASDALDRVKSWDAKYIMFVGIIAAPEGIGVVNHRHPDTPIVVAVVDRDLNTSKYILPGLGDAGDRQYNT